MPCWSIHLKIAKELQKEFNLDKDKFYFGSVLPDADSNWTKTRKELHYYNGKVFEKSPNDLAIDMNSFFKDYGDKLQDDLILGYYCHLFIDNFFNEYIYYKYWIKDSNKNVIGVKLLNGVINDAMNRNKYKHHDLELYGKTVYAKGNLEFPKNVENIMNSVILLKDNFIKKSDVSKRITYFDTEFKEFNRLSNEEYLMIDKRKIDELCSFCLNVLSKKIKEIKKN